MTVTVETMDSTALALATKLRLSIVPICGATKDGRYDAIGSGVLVRFGDHMCLATAKHVLDFNEGDKFDPLNDPTTLYVGNPVDGSLVVLTGEATSVKDPYDLALVDLSADSYVGLWQCDFLNADTDFCPSTSTVNFGMAMGYQVAAASVDDTKHQVHHNPLVYSSPACDRAAPVYVRIPIDPQRTVRGRSPYDVGPLYGVSGGGLFSLRSLTEPGAQDQLAAVIIEYDPERKQLFATDVNLLRKLYARLDHPEQV
jgi:hypothetical protein